MSRLTFNRPLLLGFDHMERMLDRANRSSDGYPPYNIEQLAENQFRITIAVAGFTMDNLHVGLEDNQLVVRGKQLDEEEKDKDGERVFLYRGIASRQFQKNFVLGDGMQVERAWLENGLLHIDLQQVRPEPYVRTIAIENLG